MDSSYRNVLWNGRESSNKKSSRKLEECIRNYTPPPPLFEFTLIRLGQRWLNSAERTLSKVTIGNVVVEEAGFILSALSSRWL
jgi:hypothetical protein